MAEIESFRVPATGFGGAGQVADGLDPWGKDPQGRETTMMMVASIADMVECS